MTYLIGVDEAGYGPNLGPLSVAATVWRVSPEQSNRDLYAILDGIVTANAAEGCRDQVVMADSKSVYSSTRGLELLESMVLATLASLDREFSNVSQLLSGCLDRESWEHRSAPGHAPEEPRLPVVASLSEIDRLAAILRSGLTSRSIELRDLRASLVFPQRFNDFVATLGNKSHVLSTVTLTLVKQLLDGLGNGEPCVIYCDKHGGRNRYGPVLQTVFPDYLVEIYEESAAQSVYRWGPAAARVEIRFTAKGERYLPSALASMMAKYLREISMASWNAFWRSHLPGLQPTAGYPVDAKRFKAEIGATQTQLGIPDDAIWRKV